MDVTVAEDIYRKEQFAQGALYDMGVKTGSMSQCREHRCILFFFYYISRETAKQYAVYLFIV